MRNAKRLLAALLLAAALIFSSASCGGQTETASEAPAAASSEPQRDYTVQISKDTLRRILSAAVAGGFKNADLLETLLSRGEVSQRVKQLATEAANAAGHANVLAIVKEGNRD